MTNNNNQEVPNEVLVAILTKTREKLATALFQTIDLEAQLEQAKATIAALKAQASEDK